jgi:DNA polymerase elongation subunit (family B)
MKFTFTIIYTDKDGIFGQVDGTADAVESTVIADQIGALIRSGVRDLTLDVKQGS